MKNREDKAMLKCDKCGKELKYINQSHFCVKAGSIDEYIVGQSEDIQTILHKVRETIRTAAPNATEKISWMMPTFWQFENLIHFCAHKNHLGIHPGALDRFPAALMDRLAGYKTYRLSFTSVITTGLSHKIFQSNREKYIVPK